MSSAPSDPSSATFPFPGGGDVGGAAEADRTARHAYLATLFEHVPVAAVVLDLAGRVAGANPACLRLFGCSAAELAGRALSELVTSHPASGEAFLQPREVLLADEVSSATIRCWDGARIQVILRRHAVRVGGVPVAWFAFCERIDGEASVTTSQAAPTIRHSEEPELDLADERHRQLLAAARALLAAPEIVENRLKRLARFLVPAVADSCIVYLGDPLDRVRRFEVALASPAQEELLREHLRNYPPEHSRLIPPVARALETGEYQLLPEVRVRDLKADPGDHQHVSVAFLLGLSSLLVVPLLHDGRVVGALSLATLDSGRCFHSSDLPLVEAIARRAATLIPAPRPGS